MWIKICGIRDRETARRVAEVGINAVGLNFYPRSPRLVAIDEAIEISKILPTEVARVGVFVNHSLPEVESFALRCRLDVLQLHGDEPPSYFVELQRRLPQIRLLRAWRMRKEGLSGLETFLSECDSQSLRLSGCLVDAHVAGVFGGSGKTVPWKKLAREYHQGTWPPLILAGGLTATNVAKAISSTQPWGIDVASGVESSPGVKDLDLVRQFVSNARGAAPMKVRL